MKLLNTLTPILLLCVLCVSAVQLFADGFFVASDTYVVTNSSTAVISVTNHPQFAGANSAWRPAGILANFHDSPTGAVLRVDHVRTGVSNPHISTNLIAVTNTLFSTNAAGATASFIWIPGAAYTVVPATDHLLITTSSTNAEIILNKNGE